MGMRNIILTSTLVLGGAGAGIWALTPDTPPPKELPPTYVCYPQGGLPKADPSLQKTASSGQTENKHATQNVWPVEIKGWVLKGAVQFNTGTLFVISPAPKGGVECSSWRDWQALTVSSEAPGKPGLGGSYFGFIPKDSTIAYRQPTISNEYINILTTTVSDTPRYFAEWGKYTGGRDYSTGIALPWPFEAASYYDVGFSPTSVPSPQKVSCPGTPATTDKEEYTYLNLPQLKQLADRIKSEITFRPETTIGSPIKIRRPYDGEKATNTQLVGPCGSHAPA